MWFLTQDDSYFTVNVCECREYLQKLFYKPWVYYTRLLALFSLRFVHSNNAYSSFTFAKLLYILSFGRKEWLILLRRQSHQFLGLWQQVICIGCIWNTNLMFQTTSSFFLELRTNGINIHYFFPSLFINIYSKI